MTTIRKTIKWMMILLLAGSAAAGGYAYYFWNQSDDLLRQVLADRLHEIAPDWNVGLARARWDFQGRIHAYDLTLSVPNAQAPLLHVSEVILTVDRERLADPQTPMRFVRWIKADLHLERDENGSWNFDRLPQLNLPKNVIPEFHADHTRVTVLLADPETGGITQATADDVNLQLIPSGARQFLVKLSAKIPGADGVSAEGNWQVDEGSWNVSGRIRNVSIDGALSKLAAEFSSEYRMATARLDALIQKRFANIVATDAGQTANGSGGPPAEARGDVIGLLGFSATADAEFRLAQWRPGAEREYKVALHVLSGELKNPLVGFPLRDLRGGIALENDQILLRDVSAQSGPTRFVLERGRILKRDDSRPADFDLAIEGLPLDERIPGLLPEAIKKVYGEVQPEGEVDLRLHLEYNGRDRWEHDCDLCARNGSVTHVKFPYRIDQIEGTITQRGELVDFAMQGRAGTQRVVLSGRVKNPGPEAASLFVIKTAGIPIDERLRAACPPRFLSVIDQLQAQGALDGTVQLIRPAGLHQNLAIVVDARCRNGSVNCRPFPYPLTSVSGRFHGAGDEWEFEDFQGRHGAAEVKCGGKFRPDAQGRPELELDFELTGATFDRQLRAALPEDLQMVWNEFHPVGGLSVSGKLFWSPAAGGRATIARLDAELVDTKVSLESFPFALSDVAARISYDGRRANITSFSGRHEEASFRVAAGFAEYTSDGQWRVRLDELFVDDLEATPQFRKALPQQLRKI